MGEITSNCCKFLGILMMLMTSFAFYSAPYFAMFTPIQDCKGDTYYLRTVQLENGKNAELPNDYLRHNFKNIFIMLAIAGAIQSAALMISLFEKCCFCMSPHRVNFFLCLSFLLLLPTLIYLEVVIHHTSLFDNCSTGFNSIAIIILLLISIPCMICNNLRSRAPEHDYQPIV
ncbi:hypothetical protein DLAC_01098 [Tieghemostelium lacteum]|uniref:Transmembrane protein n=1 Tax=Tieghemostelium lacteum TaxID=361077 RepID=A0A152A7T4_TIELA|nr:hypothetical protein DLAC_01098 [Tieghemostelium lacteum]|eukprot:KYR02268.1 hypothetical protein DLAC_01098 [Tieghemostelium lacteum]